MARARAGRLGTIAAMVVAASMVAALAVPAVGLASAIAPSNGKAVYVSSSRTSSYSYGTGYTRKGSSGIMASRASSPVYTSGGVAYLMTNTTFSLASMSTRTGLGQHMVAYAQWPVSNAAIYHGSSLVGNVHALYNSPTLSGFKTHVAGTPHKVSYRMAKYSMTVRLYSPAGKYVGTRTITGLYRADRVTYQ